MCAPQLGREAAAVQQLQRGAIRAALQLLRCSCSAAAAAAISTPHLCLLQVRMSAQAQDFKEGDRVKVKSTPLCQFELWATITKVVARNGVQCMESVCGCECLSVGVCA